MLGAIVSLVLVAAAAFAVTQVGGVITLLFIAAVLFLAYRRLSLLDLHGDLHGAARGLHAGSAPAARRRACGRASSWLLLARLWLLNVRPLRKALITRPFMKTYLKLLPSMSQTEKEALEAGTVWWDGELFTGAPRWEKLLAAKPPQLSAEEQAFLDGPCEELCRMLDDWDITHERGDMPPQVWEFLKTRGFFAMIIPKKYGGLEFSAYAHSCVLAKIASRSATASSTVAVPNSLGPAELLNHYGTEEQKNYYLPRLARGEEVPCFALTGPRAGSDAGSIPDTGIVCRGTWQGREIARGAAQLRQALHHPRPGGDRHRPGLPPVRSGQAARRQGRRRHHLRTHPAQHPRGQHRPAPLPAQHSVPERSHPGPGRVRAAGRHHRRTEAWRAAAGACWWSSSRWAAASRCPPTPPAAPRRRVWATGAYARIRTPVQHAGGQVRGRGGGDRAHGRTHLHHRCRALGDRRRHRRRREAFRAFRRS